MQFSRKSSLPWPECCHGSITRRSIRPPSRSRLQTWQPYGRRAMSTPSTGRYLWQFTLGEVAALIRDREVSPIEVTRASLERIEQTDSHVLAWARLCAERALDDAKRMEELLRAGKYLGPLHGIPVGIKDIIQTAGVEMSAGSRILAGFVPTEDAEVVRRLRLAGAVILGKTATTQFALFDPAP